jgi:hypothetical protein
LIARPAAVGLAAGALVGAVVAPGPHAPRANPAAVTADTFRKPRRVIYFLPIFHLLLLVE